MKKILLTFMFMFSLPSFAGDMEFTSLDEICYDLRGDEERCMEFIYNKDSNGYMNSICSRVAGADIASGRKCLELTVGNNYEELTMNELMSLYELSGSNLEGVLAKIEGLESTAKGISMDKALTLAETIIAAGTGNETISNIDKIITENSKDDINTAIIIYKLAGRESFKTVLEIVKNSSTEERNCIISGVESYPRSWLRNIAKMCK